MKVTVNSPLSGEIIALSAVPDVVFASGIMGPGIAIKPELAGGEQRQEVVAPVTGILTKVFPHAFLITVLPADGDFADLENTQILEQGTSVLVHLGLDTVRLEGEGFEILVENGEKVTVGQPIIAWQPATVAAAGFNTLCPVVIVNGVHAKIFHSYPTGQYVQPGTSLFTCYED